MLWRVIAYILMEERGGERINSNFQFSIIVISVEIKQCMFNTYLIKTHLYHFSIKFQYYKIMNTFNMLSVFILIL